MSTRGAYDSAAKKVFFSNITNALIYLGFFTLIGFAIYYTNDIRALIALFLMVFLPSKKPAISIKSNSVFEGEKKNGLPDFKNPPPPPPNDLMNEDGMKKRPNMSRDTPPNTSIDFSYATGKEV